MPEYVGPADNIFPRVPGTDVGVIGGIPTNRTNILNVVTDYNASGTITQTTGSITSGSPTLTVANAATFAANQGIVVYYNAIQELTITGGATSTSYFYLDVWLDDIGNGIRVQINVTSGMTAAQVADVVRETTFRQWDVGGSGDVCIFSCRSNGAKSTLVFTDSGGSGVTASVAVTQSGNTAAQTTINSVVGTTITLNANSSANITNGVVAHDDTDAVHAAIAAASSGDILYFPSGTYRCRDITCLKDNITFRGDGITLTRIDSHATSASFGLGDYSGSDYAWGNQFYAVPSTDNTVTDGLSKGSTTVTIADTTGFSDGQLIQIAYSNQTDDTEIDGGAIPVIAIDGSETKRRQLTRLVSHTGTDLTIFPGLLWTPDDNLTAHANYLTNHLDGIGVEEIWVDMINSKAGFSFDCKGNYGGWFLNVRISYARNYSISWADCLNCEIRRVTIENIPGFSSNNSGLLMNHSANCLIEDSILNEVFPCLEMNDGCTGNVFGYNFSFIGNGGCAFNVNHGAHNSHNHFEGNIITSTQSDGYFGGASNLNWFRNWITGTLYGSSVPFSFIISLNRFSREMQFTGNVIGTAGWPYGANPYSLGNPNIGNSDYIGTAQPTGGDFWQDWKLTAVLTTRTSDTEGVLTMSAAVTDVITATNAITLVWGDGSNGNPALRAFIPAASVVVSGTSLTISNAIGTLPIEGTTDIAVWTGALGYQEQDRDCFETFNAFPGTTTLAANYHAWAEGGDDIPEDQDILPDTLAESWYTSKAASESRGMVWGGLTYPPFDPYSPGDTTENGWERIPAGYRFVNGVDPPEVLPGVTFGSGSGSTTFTGAGTVTFG